MVFFLVVDVKAWILPHTLRMAAQKDSRIMLPLPGGHMALNAWLLGHCGVG